MTIKDNLQDVLDEIPATREHIAKELDISRRAVRYRMNTLEDEHGYKFYMDSGNVWREVSDKVERDDDEPLRVNSYDKAQLTKDVNNELAEIEKEIKQALSNTEPVVNDYTRSDNSSTLVMPHSDSHIGAIIRERNDVDYYSAEEAQEVIREYFDRAITFARGFEDVEDVALIMNGDHLDGEGVYAAQRHEQEDNLRDQLRKAGRVYAEQIVKLSEDFDHVSVYCVPGNHGNIDKKSTSNADMMLYDFVEMGVDYSDADNINIEKAGPGGFLNFSIRGWDYHARHGDDFLNHVGTSSGQNRAKDAYMSYTYDVLLRSHYHSVKYETIGDEIPIVMTGSPAPPSTFAESRGADGGRCGIFWLASEESPIEHFEPIRVGSKKNT